MSRPHALRIEGTASAGRILIDGLPVQCQALHLQLSADGPLLAGLVLPLGEVTVDEARAVIALDEGTRQVLAALGWTPPPGDDGTPGGLPGGQP